MDARNRYESKTTYRLLRLEYLIGLLFAFYLLARNFGEVNWLLFAVLFAYIDLIGYIPGAIAFHRSQSKRIPRVYYVLYNTMHSMAVQAAVAIAWAIFVHPEWALLALPIHLCGDRALFGNFLKPLRVSFEPTAHPAFTRMEADLGHADSGARASEPAGPRQYAAP
jgi:hypothetical protein